jgi:hypothetical protein
VRQGGRVPLQSIGVRPCLESTTLTARTGDTALDMPWTDSPQSSTPESDTGARAAAGPDQRHGRSQAVAALHTGNGGQVDGSGVEPV